MSGKLLYHVIESIFSYQSLSLEADATLMIITINKCFKFAVQSVLNTGTSAFLYCLQ